MSNYCKDCKHCFRTVSNFACENHNVVEVKVSQVTGATEYNKNDCEFARSKCKGIYFERKVSKLDKVLERFGELMNAFLHW